MTTSSDTLATISDTLATIAAPCASQWPEVVVLLGLFALVAWGAWLFTKYMLPN